MTKHQLNKAVKEMKQLKPLLLQSNQELEMLQKKNILDFFTSEEKEVWEILQFNKIIAEATVVAAEASLEEAKYVVLGYRSDTVEIFFVRRTFLFF